MIDWIPVTERMPPKSMYCWLETDWGTIPVQAIAPADNRLSATEFRDMLGISYRQNNPRIHRWTELKVPE